MPDLNCEVQDLLSEVVDLKQEVADLRSGGNHSLQLNPWPWVTPRLLLLLQHTPSITEKSTHAQKSSQKPRHIWWSRPLSQPGIQWWTFVAGKKSSFYTSGESTVSSFHIYATDFSHHFVRKKISELSITVTALILALLVSQRSYGHFLKLTDSFLFQ